MTNPIIRTLDLKHFTYGNSAQRAAFSEQFAAGLKETGFIILEGHGVDPKLIDKNYELWQKLFSLDTDKKKQYYPLSSIRGINGSKCDSCGRT